MSAMPAVGELLREWRQRRRLSQLGLATEAEISQRHLSFLESGRAMPSREMVLRLARHLELPPRERNALMLAAGFAPAHRERPLTDPALAPARRAVELVLAAHEPFPALAVDRHWTLVMANRALAILLEGIRPELLAPPVNVLRVSFHPEGLAPRIVNFAAWREHALERLAQQVAASGDRALADLARELRALAPPTPIASPAPEPATAPVSADVAVPIQIRTSHGVLSFLTTTTVFGTPVDVTLSELAIETFLPADPETSEALRKLAQR